MAVLPTKPPVGGAQLAAVLAALVDEASASASASFASSIAPRETFDQLSAPDFAPSR